MSAFQPAKLLLARLLVGCRAMVCCVAYVAVRMIITRSSDDARGFRCPLTPTVKMSAICSSQINLLPLAVIRLSSTCGLELSSDPFMPGT